MNKIRIAFASVLCLAILLGASALESAMVGAQGATKTETLKIGLLGPMSGGSASWGIGIKRAAEMFIEETNAAGGLRVGDTIYRLELIAYDHKGQAAEAVTAANRLVYHDGVKYILGNSLGATCEAVQGITEPEQILFTFICWGDNLGPENPYSFRTYLGPLEVAEPLYRWLAENKPEIRRIALISPNDQSGVWTVRAIEKSAKELGMEITAIELYERDSQDFVSMLTRMIATQPDMIDLASSPPGEGSLILKQLWELGYKGPKAWTSSSEMDPVVAIAGIEATEGIWTATSWDMESEVVLPQTREWARKYREKYGDAAFVNAAANYVAYEIVTTAMQIAQSIDVNDVLKVLESDRQWDTILGTVVIGGYEFYKINRQVLYPVFVSEMRQGKLVPLARANPPGL